MTQDADNNPIPVLDLDRFRIAGVSSKPPCPVESARRAGLSDKQIIDWQARHVGGFDVVAARGEGYSDDQIIQYLSVCDNVPDADGGAPERVPASTLEAASPVQSAGGEGVEELELNPYLPSAAADVDSIQQEHWLPPTPEEALALGWSITPCGPDKKSLLNWKQYQTRRPTPQEVKKWQRVLRPACWAMISGEISGEIGLDFDGEKGRETMLRLGLSPQRITPSGGYHSRIAWPGFHVKTSNGKGRTT